MMRPLSLVWIVGLLVGCTEPCREGTLFVSVTLQGMAEQADGLAVTISVDGASTGGMSFPRTRQGAGESFEVSFAAGYPAGKSATLTVNAKRGDQTIAAQTATLMLTSSGCTRLDLTLGNAGAATKHLGERCGATDVCDTGFCVDGYCCDSGCDGQCQTCDVDAAPGRCTTIQGATHGSRQACTGTGSMCGGTCDGTQAAACSYPTSQCVAPSCQNGVATASASCAAGVCPSTAPAPCELKSCDGTACATVKQLATSGSYYIGSMALGHTCAVISDGTLRCWGANNHGQLGMGETDTAERHVPTVVPGLSDVVQVATGPYSTCVLLKNQTMQCFGANDYGQLGRGIKDGNPHGAPQPVGGLATGVVQIGAGELLMCALLTNASVQCWGDNGFGALGDGTTMQRLQPGYVCGSVGPCNFGSSLQNVAELTVGGLHSCARVFGSLYCWGFSGNGQLGPNGATMSSNNPTPVQVPNVSAARVSAGGQETCVLLQDGTVQCWGYNGTGQLGTATVAASSNTPAFVCDPAGCPAKLANVAQVAVGSDFACARLKSGTVTCWGGNAYGQLGDGSNTPQNFPATSVVSLAGVSDLVAHGGQACAILTNGSVRCWGSDQSGQLGDNDTAFKKTPVAPSW